MNLYTTNVHCDGAMDSDKRQTEGNGSFIEFPESILLELIPVYLGSEDFYYVRLEKIQ